MSGHRPSWLGVALAAAGGFLAGVLLVAVLGGPKGTVHTRTRTTTHVETRQQTVTVDGSPRVPDVSGQRLPEARKALESAGFDVAVNDDTLFGVIDESHFIVIGQDPPGGERLQAGGTVTVDVGRN